jgi:hypothetical protein
MKTIGELLARDLSRKIEEIIQVDQADEQSVHDEITEYVATDSIREQYHHLLRAVADAPSEPNESVGVWVSGFFGSGKSSFAKNLGYALENRVVLGSKFADLFKQQLGDARTSDLLDLINAQTPTEVIHVEQLHIKQIHSVQSLADANRQVAVHSPAPAQAAINLCTETNVAVDNLHHRLLFSRSRISIRFREGNVTIHAHIEPIARSNLHCGLDIQILARHLHAQLAKLLAKRLSRLGAR